MMLFRANMQAATEQPPPAAVNRHQILLTLIQQLNKLMKLIKDWLQQQRMAQVLMAYQTMVGRKSLVDDDHVEGNKNGQPSKILCGICFDLKPVIDVFIGGNCNHPFCTDCISKYVATKIQQNILKVNCPNPNCYVELQPHNLQNTLPKEVIDRWESARYESSIDGRQKTYCPFKNCSALLVNDGVEVVTSSECPSCHRLFCAQCKAPWHAGMNCKEFQRKLKGSKHEKDSDKKFLEVAKEEKWQRCPKCTMYVQKRSGCEHMKCRCGCNFCYNCGKDWMYGHTCKKTSNHIRFHWLTRAWTRGKRHIQMLFKCSKGLDKDNLVRKIRKVD